MAARRQGPAAPALAHVRFTNPSAVAGGARRCHSPSHPADTTPCFAAPANHGLSVPSARSAESAGRDAQRHQPTPRRGHPAPAHAGQAFAKLAEASPKRRSSGQRVEGRTRAALRRAERVPDRETTHIGGRRSRTSSRTGGVSTSSSADRSSTSFSASSPSWLVPVVELALWPGNTSNQRPCRRR